MASGCAAVLDTVVVADADVVLGVAVSIEGEGVDADEADELGRVYMGVVGCALATEL